MRKIIMTAIISIITLGTKAQNQLGWPQDTVVKYQNAFLQSNLPGFKIEFVGAARNEFKGITLTYRSIGLDENGEKSISYDAYVFDERDTLFKYIIYTDAMKELNIVNNLQLNAAYYKINDHLLYSKNEDVKVTIETKKINDGDWVIFTYIKKSTKTAFD